ncbi:enoyl-CoA hydratase/isomerase family protein [Streptomyces viridiviolaceus]
MTARDLIAESAEGVLTLTLNRPERLNALSDDMLDGLVEQLRTVEQDTVAVIIRGAGRAFCSGHDLKHAAAQGPLNTVSARAVAQRMQRVAHAMRECRVPIITQVHGYAIGGGAEIALSGDIVIVDEECVFQFTEASVGRVVTNGFTNLLPRTVGPVRAKSLLLMGRPLSGAEAASWGLATEAVPGTGLEIAVNGAVQVLGEQSAWAVGAAKNLVNRGLQASFEATIDLEIGAAIEAELGADAESGAQSFART